MTSTEIVAATDNNAPATPATLRGAARSALALAPDQSDWTPEQLAGLRQLGIEDAPEGDLLVFRHVCQTTGLDPFRKQIYMIGRKTKVKYWDEAQRRQVEDWVMKYTIQTGIDGFRRNGREAAKREGAAIRVDGPYWQGEDGGGWSDVWLSSKPPAAAKFVIFRDGEAHTGIAMYREFVQTMPGSDAPNSMWRKMPANQLAKCAEAQAWRRAYPDDFSGVQLEDAVQIIEPDGTSSVRVQSERVTADQLLAATSGESPAPQVQQWQAPADGPADAASSEGEKQDTALADESPSDAAGKAEPTPEPATREQLQRLSSLLEREGLNSAVRKRKYLSEQFGRVIGSARELTADEAVALTRYLENPEGEKLDTVSEATVVGAVEADARAEGEASDQ
ncbi:recombinase RecT [Nocardia cyriacigeorgica]|uniref:recombinase RecT n=1 Tax=Nocardia cyriacigeorgica TaxID=135487 RepID=UPI0018956223|nr:recombinase RecT [Nocardia cyriacigeorgica]MBF6289282.1 recombinase RecT [Nocardia cyriacigeorgica]